jgi:hypothetical protein
VYLKGEFIMAKANEIANVLATLVAGGMQQQDTLSEFTEKVNKEDLVNQNKKSTNAKWMAWDIATSIGGMVINQYRQRQFQNLQENAEKEADAQLKERQQKLDNLKANLGISELEEKIQKQDKMLEDISKMISHLVAENKKEKKEKEVKNLPKVKLNNKDAKKSAKADDNYWL